MYKIFYDREEYEFFDTAEDVANEFITLRKDWFSDMIYDHEKFGDDEPTEEGWRAYVEEMYEVTLTQNVQDFI